MRPDLGNTAIRLDQLFEPTVVEDALRFVGNTALADEMHLFTPEYITVQQDSKGDERRLPNDARLGDLFDVFFNSTTASYKPSADTAGKYPTIDELFRERIGYGSDLLIKGSSAQVVLDALVAVSKVKGRKFENQGLPKSTPKLAKIMVDQYKAQI